MDELGGMFSVPLGTIPIMDETSERREQDKRRIAAMKVKQPSNPHLFETFILTSDPILPSRRSLSYQYDIHDSQAITAHWPQHRSVECKTIDGTIISGWLYEIEGIAPAIIISHGVGFLSYTKLCQKPPNQYHAQHLKY